MKLLVVQFSPSDITILERYSVCSLLTHSSVLILTCLAYIVLMHSNASDFVFHVPTTVITMRSVFLFIISWFCRLMLQFSVPVVYIRMMRCYVGRECDLF